MRDRRHLELVVSSCPISRPVRSGSVQPLTLGVGARLAWTLIALLAVMVSIPGVAWPAGARKKAASDYERAVRMRAELESRPQRSRSIEDYRQLIIAFQAVCKTDPAYEKSPAALADAAQLLEEMGWQFSDHRYYVASIEGYRFLIAQYPGGSLSRDALFTMGEIYRVDLIQPHEARQIFQRFVALYPNAAKAPLAREKLKQIERFEAKANPQSPRVLEGDLPPEPGVGAAAIQAPTQAPTKTETDADAGAPPASPSPYEARPTGSRSSGNLPELTGVRFWVGSNYTRVVIALDDEVKFSSARLAHPDRLVFDLSGCRLSPSVVGKTFAVEDRGFLRQVRVAQFKPSVARAVLDVKKIAEYSVFSLPNPFRLVIDIHGTPTEPAPAVAVNAAEPAVAPSEARSATRGMASAGAGSTAGRVTQQPAATNLASKPRMTPKETVPTVRPEPVADVMASPGAPSASLSSGAANGPAARAGGPVGGGDQSAKSAPLDSPDETASNDPTGQDRARSLTRVLGLKIGRIVIDPGHGGHDTGALGPHGLREKDLVLDVGLRLRTLLERKTDADVVMTRADDTFIPLEQRTALANQKAADLFISIHANASRDPSARAIETYYLNFTSDPGALQVAARENASSAQSVHELQSLVKKIVLTEKIKESHDFAAEVQRSLYAGLTAAGAREVDHGVKRAPFVVLIGASMPSILAEISFVTNPRDEKLLKKPEYRQKIAEALYRGVERYASNLGGIRYAGQRPEPGLRASSPPSAPPLATIVSPGK